MIFVYINIQNKTMEVREIVETIIREPVLEVRFRMDVDDDNVIRVKEFIIDEIEDYGYEVIIENSDIFDVWDDEDDDEGLDYDDNDDEDLEVDEDELISFMNEFFMISGDIPDPDFF
jgi:hypothetical protein